MAEIDYDEIDDRIEAKIMEILDELFLEETSKEPVSDRRTVRASKKRKRFESKDWGDSMKVDEPFMTAKQMMDNEKNKIVF